MGSDGPRVGQPVTVERTEGPEAHRIHEGKIEGVASGRFQIALESAKAGGALAPGSEVRVRWTDDQGLCFFLARVLETEGARTWIELPANPERLQRRRFVRLPVEAAISCVRLDERGEPREVCRAMTLELGGNGAGLVADRPFKVGERVRFKLELGGGFGVCSGIAHVKRSALAHKTKGKGSEHRVALQFVEIDAPSQARILSFLLQEQEGQAVAAVGR